MEVYLQLYDFITLTVTSVDITAREHTMPPTTFLVDLILTGLSIYLYLYKSRRSSLIAWLGALSWQVMCHTVTADVISSDFIGYSVTVMIYCVKELLSEVPNANNIVRAGEKNVSSFQDKAGLLSTEA